MISSGRQRRNSGRTLVVVIESSDNGDVDALSALNLLTLDRFRSTYPEHDDSLWPTDVAALLDGTGAARRWVRTDDGDEIHTFVLADCNTYDVLIGVSSRRARNVAGERSDNVASNTLLELLEQLDEEGRAVYGTLHARYSNRLFRHEVGGMMVIDVCRDWDIVIETEDLRYDPTTDPIPYAAAMTVVQNAAAATHLVKNSAAHKHNALPGGVNKWSRTTTTPILWEHPETRQLSWDPNVVDAIRSTVQLLRDGLSWAECADAVGDLIPSYPLRAEPDVGSANSKTSTRTERNRDRINEGRPPVELKYHQDGSPNPNYRPESVLDLPVQGQALRTLLLRGANVSGDVRSAVAAQLETQLGGLHPDETTLELLSTGVFRRLVKDQGASNRSRDIYKYISFQLPPFEVDDEGNEHFPLTFADVEYLRTHRTGRSNPGPKGTLPLIGIFSAELEGPVLTDSGTIQPSKSPNAVHRKLDGTDLVGTMSWRAAKSKQGNSIYRVIFAGPGLRGNVVVGVVPADLMHRSVVEAVSSALESNPTSATFDARYRSHLPGGAELAAAERAVDSADSDFKGAVNALAENDLSPRIRAMLKEKADAAERQLDQAQQAFDEASAGMLTTNIDTVPLDNLIDVLAAVELPHPLDPGIAARIQRRIADIMRDPKILVDPHTQQLRWSAVIELRAESGLMMRLPVGGVVPNSCDNVWLAWPAGTMWTRRCTIFDAIAAHDLSASKQPSSVSRWRRRVERRLLAESDVRGVSWRGPNAVNLFARSPYEAITQVGFAIALAESTDRYDPDLVDAVQRTFFGDGPDLPPSNASNWSPNSVKSTVVRELIELAGPE